MYKVCSIRLENIDLVIGGVPHVEHLAVVDDILTGFDLEKATYKKKSNLNLCV